MSWNAPSADVGYLALLQECALSDLSYSRCRDDEEHLSDSDIIKYRPGQCSLQRMREPFLSET